MRFYITRKKKPPGGGKDLKKRRHKKIEKTGAKRKTVRSKKHTRHGTRFSGKRKAQDTGGRPEKSFTKKRKNFRKDSEKEMEGNICTDQADGRWLLGIAASRALLLDIAKEGGGSGFAREKSGVGGGDSKKREMERQRVRETAGRRPGLSSAKGGPLDSLKRLRWHGETGKAIGKTELHSSGRMLKKGTREKRWGKRKASKNEEVGMAILKATTKEIDQGGKGGGI